MKNRLKRFMLYLLVLFFLAADYFSLPSGLLILERLKKWGYMDLLFPLIYVTLLVCAVIAVRGKPANLGLKRTVFVLIAVALSALYFMKLKEPNLKIHFLEYELLTILLFKALELDVKTKIIYPMTLASITALGIIEEIIQSIYPTRTFDLNDLKIDFFSSLIMIVIIYLFKSGHRSAQKT